MINKEILIRLWDKTIINSNNCWIYNGSNSGDNYTTIWFNYQQQYVHRVSAHLHFGFDLTDKSIQINHKPICKSRKCWNPEHIYIGSQQENIQDKIQTGTNQKGIFGKAILEKNQTHCKHGHKFTPENTRTYKGKRQCKQCGKIRDSIRVRISINHVKIEAKK